jgi:uncharacterized iron-regulated membrane protein
VTAAVATPRNRVALVWLHRWVGLVMALFLVIAGLTGSLLVWYHELDRVFAAQLYRLPAPTQHAAPLDPLLLRERVQAAYPQAWVHHVDLHRQAGEAAVFYLEGPADPRTGEHLELPNDEVFVDPSTGAVLGERKWGAITQGWHNLMPFVYRLHYQLALGTVGGYLFGIVALLWTIDCFVSGYLTFPLRRRAGVPLEAGSRAGWLARWRPALLVRWRAGGYKLNFDLHRAGGLWTWAMLFVLAWSSVAFNLGEVYRPVMKLVFSLDEREKALPSLKQDQPQPGLSWTQALQVARGHGLTESQRLGFALERERGLRYDPHKAVFRYIVNTDADLHDRYGMTRIIFDANSGALKYTDLPTGQYSGDTVTNWLYSLHMAQVWGLPFRVFVTVIGVVVAMLSVTGIVIWLAKLRARRSIRRMQRLAASGPPLAAGRDAFAQDAAMTHRTATEDGLKSGSVPAPEVGRV